MELLMRLSHMYLQDIKSSPSLTGQTSNRSVSSIRLNLLTKTTWKLKTPGGILVFQILVQVWGRPVGVSDMWQLTGDTWHITRDTWHMTHDTWHMTRDTWHGTHDNWHMTPDTYLRSIPIRWEICVSRMQDFLCCLTRDWSFWEIMEQYLCKNAFQFFFRKKIRQIFLIPVLIEEHQIIYSTA